MGGATQDKQPWTAMTANGIKPLRYASPPFCTSVSTQSCDWCCHQKLRFNCRNQMQDAALTRLCGMTENNFLVPELWHFQQLERTCSAVHRRAGNQQVLLQDVVGTEIQTWYSLAQTLCLVTAVKDDCFLRDRRTFVATEKTGVSPLLSVPPERRWRLDLKAESSVHTLVCLGDMSWMVEAHLLKRHILGFVWLSCSGGLVVTYTNASRSDESSW